MLKLKDETLLRPDAYIDGAWTSSGKRFAVTDKATGETIADVADLDAAGARRAIEAANAAGPAWRAKTAKERANLMRKWFDLIMANQEDLARLMTAEQGKPLAETRGEAFYRGELSQQIAAFAREHGAALDESDLHALGGRRLRDPGADDPAADHEQVERGRA